MSVTYSIESNHQTGTYKTLVMTTRQDNAVELFSAALDQRVPSESVRLLRNGVLMARKTPKTAFMAEQWSGLAL